MTLDLPALVVTVTVWLYWGCVAALVVRSHVRFGAAAGAVPRTGRERSMWMVWVPTVVLWHLSPIAAMYASWTVLALPSFAEHTVIYTIRSCAASLAVLAYLLTIPCWLFMGRNWSMAVVPMKRTRLITTGMFARVRHPIYGLSILLMASTMAAVPSPAMFVVGVVHCCLIALKVRSEEQYLRQLYGEEYADYCRRTNRFLPRVFFPLQSLQPAQHSNPDAQDRDRAA